MDTKRRRGGTKERKMRCAPGLCVMIRVSSVKYGDAQTVETFTGSFWRWKMHE